MSTTINTTPIDIEITKANNNVNVTTTPISIEVSNADRNVSVETKPIDISIENTPINVSVSTVGGVISGLTKIFYTTTFAFGTSFTISSAEHELLTVNGAIFYHPSGSEVSVQYSVINNDVIILSNINLLNHVIKIY